MYILVVYNSLEKNVYIFNKCLHISIMHSEIMRNKKRTVNVLKISLLSLQLYVRLYMIFIVNFLYFSVNNLIIYLVNKCLDSTYVVFTTETRIGFILMQF